MKKRFALVLMIIILFLFWGSLRGLFYYTRSLVIMYPYSRFHYEKSILSEIPLTIQFPKFTSSDRQSWFPFVLTFSDDNGFSDFSGKQVHYTVLYGFPRFDIQQAGSVYYQPDSPFYSSFYGAYVIQNKDRKKTPFGFDNGKINLEQVQQLSEYDQLKLVLPSLGCQEDLRTFRAETDLLEENSFCAETYGWTKVDGTVVTNSPSHQYIHHQPGYLQYGLPPEDYDGGDFELMKLKGRLYAKYFPDHQVTVVFYLVGKDADFINIWDKALLSKALVEFGE